MRMKVLREQSLLKIVRRLLEFGVDGSTRFDTPHLVDGTFDSQAPHPINQCRARNTQPGSGARRPTQNPVGISQNLQHVFTLDFFQSRTLRTLRFAFAQLSQGRAQRCSLRQDHRALNEVLQFADISRPRIADQRIHYGLGNPRDLPVHRLGKLVDKISHQNRDVIAPLAKRRNVNWKNIQPVIEVGAKGSLLHHASQVAIRSCYQTNICANRSRPAQSFKFLLLQNSQQLWLQLQRYVAHFIQKQRALMRDLKPPDLATDGARKCTALVPEQLALQQTERDRRAIQLYENVVLSRTERMDRSCHQFLSGAGLSLDENRGVIRCDGLYLPQYLAQAIAVAKDVFKMMLSANLIAQVQSFFRQPFFRLAQLAE